MRFLIAPDKFKGSLSASQAASAIRDGLARVFPDAELDLCPLADGGEGTLELLHRAFDGQVRHTVVPGPLGRSVDARWLVLTSDGAAIEAAKCLSLSHLAPDPPDPARATSAGLGRLIRAAIDAGARDLLIGLGGTATMDGGAGALEALGARLLDAGGQPLPPGGAALNRLDHVDLTPLAALHGLRFEALCDVESPLSGPEGAPRLFGPQKGADPAMVATLEAGLERWRAVLSRTVPAAREQVPGDGAAGGLGFGLRVGLGATLTSGGEYLLRRTGVARRLEGATLLVTGEGSIDAQTLQGKLVGRLAALADAHGIPVVALGGQVQPLPDGRDYPFLTLSLFTAPQPLDAAIADTARRLEWSAALLGRLLRIGGMQRP